MSGDRNRIGNLLFWFQIVMGVLFAVAQALKMLESTQGVSLAFFLCHGAFAALNVSLAVVALHQSHGSERKIKKQSVKIYLMWTAFMVIHIVIAVWKMPDLWNYTDTITTTVVFIGVAATLALARSNGIPLVDPRVKMWLAIFFKSLPQIFLAYTISVYGQGGLSGWWIFLGHVTILTRLVHLWISNHHEWNRNTKCSFVSEVWNEASWLVTSAAWLIF